MAIAAPEGRTRPGERPGPDRAIPAAASGGALARPAGPRPARRNERLDALRGLAIGCVVVMHNTLEHVATPAQILVGSFLHNLVTFGVPLFFALSGYFLARDQSRDFWAYARGKFLRVGLPALVWTALFWLILGALGAVRSFSPGDLFWDLLTLQNPPHYYFSFVLLALLGIGYALKRLDTGALRLALWGALGLNLGTIALYEVAIWRVDAALLPGAAMYRNPLAWGFFFVLGLYLGRADPGLDGAWFAFLARHRVAAVTIAAACYLATSLETWRLFDRLAPGGQDYFKVASFLYELLAVSGALGLSRYLGSAHLPGRVLRRLAPYAFFIYLIHLPVVPKLMAVDRPLLRHPARPGDARPGAPAPGAGTATARPPHRYPQRVRRGARRGAGP